MYPEDIAVLFERVPVGTPVTVVNQPLLYRWQGDSLYVQSYPPHESPSAATAAAGDEVDEVAGPASVPFDDPLSSQIWQAAKPHGAPVNWILTEQVVTQARGVAVPVSRRGLTLERYVASARLVENALPDGANWDGRDGETPADTTASGRGGGR
jgi:L,D-transpeptidase ErfK/SrfK